MAGKNYIITGASSGIGKETCIALANNGHSLILIGRDSKKLEEVFNLLPKNSHKVISFDVSQIAEIEELTKNIKEEYGHIDGFVHCAGHAGYMKLRHTNYDCLHGFMLVHYYAFMEFVRALCISKKKSQQLSIIAISSLATTTTEKYFTAYASAKAALEASIRTLSSELATHNTRICSLRLGMTDTPMVAMNKELHGDYDEYLKKSGHQPLGLIEPVAVAHTIEFLLDRGMEYVSGVNIPINAGGHF